MVDTYISTASWWSEALGDPFAQVLRRNGANSAEYGTWFYQTTPLGILHRGLVLAVFLNDLLERSEVENAYMSIAVRLGKYAMQVIIAPLIGSSNPAWANFSFFCFRRLR